MQNSSKKGPVKPAPKRKKGSKNILVTIVAIIIVGAFLVMMVYQPSHRKNDDEVIKPLKTPEFRKDGTLSFFTQGGRETVTIDIEVAKEQAAIMRGLMYRPQMEEDRGMLFVFPGEEERSFWMKNTYLALDIIFVDANKKIVTIQENTQPLSEEPVLSYKPAKYVIEVNAGFADRHGIRPGDKISFTY
jgi:uncharacterized membrane protein (UPF0127 family)